MIIFKENDPDVPPWHRLEEGLSCPIPALLRGCESPSPHPPTLFGDSPQDRSCPVGTPGHLGPT